MTGDPLIYLNGDIVETAAEVGRNLAHRPFHEFVEFSW